MQLVRETSWDGVELEDNVDGSEGRTCSDALEEHRRKPLVGGEVGTFRHTRCMLVVDIGDIRVLHMDDGGRDKENGVARGIVDICGGMVAFRSRAVPIHARADLHSHRPPCFRSKT